MSRKALLVVGLGIALLLAGLVSYYASSAPDGLEKVATDQGLADGGDSATAGSPLAGYQVRDVADERASVGIAGVVGVGLTFALAGGTFYLIARRRRPGAD